MLSEKQDPRIKSHKAIQYPGLYGLLSRFLEMEGEAVAECDYMFPEGKKRISFQKYSLSKHGHSVTVQSPSHESIVCSLGLFNLKYKVKSSRGSKASMFSIAQSISMIKEGYRISHCFCRSRLFEIQLQVCIWLRLTIFVPVVFDLLHLHSLGPLICSTWSFRNFWGQWLLSYTSLLVYQAIWYWHVKLSTDHLRKTIKLWTLIT